LVPEQGQAHVLARVKLIADGQQVGPTRTVMLVQQGATFTGRVPVFEQGGEVLIEIEGSYYGTQRTASTSLRLTAPCTSGALPCFWAQHQRQVVLVTPLAAILLLILILLAVFQPRPFGYLHSTMNDGVDIALKALPRFPAKLVRRSTIKVDDIMNYARSYKDFPFRTAKFDIIFKRGHKAFIRAAKNNYLSIGILIPDSPDMLHSFAGRGSGRSRILNQAQQYIELEPGELRELPFGSIIVIDGHSVASFESQATPEL
jgi:hypothetical protein